MADDVPPICIQGRTQPPNKSMERDSLPLAAHARRSANGWI